jgi:hypothetical protein
MIMLSCRGGPPRRTGHHVGSTTHNAGRGIIPHVRRAGGEVDLDRRRKAQHGISSSVRTSVWRFWPSKSRGTRTIRPDARTTSYG